MRRGEPESVARGREEGRERLTAGAAPTSNLGAAGHNLDGAWGFLGAVMAQQKKETSKEGEFFLV